MDAYSQLKPLHHRDRIDSLRARGVAVPVHLQLVLSDLCNQDCSFCAYRISEGLSSELFGTAETHNPNRKIPTAKAQEIIRDFAAAGGKAIQFTGGGEPTVHPDHLDLFALAQGCGLETALVTNGVRLVAGHPAIRAMRWIRVSVDAGTEATYCRVRRVAASHWRKVWAVIAELAKNSTTRLGVGFVATPENHHEMAACARLCADAGVPYMRVGAVFTTRGRAYYPDLSAIADSISKAQEVPGVEVLDLFGRRIDELDSGHPTDPWCGYQYLTTYVGADLGVYRCCNTSYTLAGKVADLSKTTLMEHLLGQEPDGFDARRCRACQFLGQNKAIASLVRQPDDVNFP